MQYHQELHYTTFMHDLTIGILLLSPSASSSPYLFPMTVMLLKTGKDEPREYSPLQTPCYSSSSPAYKGREITDVILGDSLYKLHQFSDHLEEGHELITYCNVLLSINCMLPTR